MIHPSNLCPLRRIRRSLVMQLDNKPRDVTPLPVEPDGDMAVRTAGLDMSSFVVS